MNADPLLQLILPYLLLLARVSAFLIVLPIFGWKSLPTVVRAGMALTLTFFFAISGIGRVDVDISGAGALEMGLLTVRELACGLALGLAVQFVFLAVQQAANIMAMQMGFGDAGIVDPAMGSGHFLVRAVEWLADRIIDHPTTRRMTERIIATGSTAARARRS